MVCQPDRPTSDFGNLMLTLLTQSDCLTRMKHGGRVLRIYGGSEKELKLFSGYSCRRFQLDCVSIKRGMRRLIRSPVPSNRQTPSSQNTGRRYPKMKLQMFVLVISFGPGLCFRIVTIPTEACNKCWPTFIGVNFKVPLQRKP